MPFELGLATAMRAIQGKHDFFLFEAVAYRLQKTLSDVNGIDPHIHNGRRDGALRCLLDCFGTTGKKQPKYEDLRELVRKLSRTSGELKRSQKAKSLFTASLFRQLVEAATELAQSGGWIR